MLVVMFKGRKTDDYIDTLRGERYSFVRANLELQIISSIFTLSVSDSLPRNIHSYHTLRHFCKQRRTIALTAGDIKNILISDQLTNH